MVVACSRLYFMEVTKAGWGAFLEILHHFFRKPNHYCPLLFSFTHKHSTHLMEATEDSAVPLNS